jgi:hypothetical protein
MNLRSVSDHSPFRFKIMNVVSPYQMLRVALLAISALMIFVSAMLLLIR